MLCEELLGHPSIQRREPQGGPLVWTCSVLDARCAAPTAIVGHALLGGQNFEVIKSYRKRYLDRIVAANSRVWTQESWHFFYMRG